MINPGEGEYPRNCVTWVEALTYCQKRGMRLPNEAEWEYAASGPDNLLYPWGNNPDFTYGVIRSDIVNQAEGAALLPVGNKQNDISWVGAKDMGGGLREFTVNIWDTRTLSSAIEFNLYPYSSTDGREVLENQGSYKLRETNPLEHENTTTLRVLRGGAFDFYIGEATTHTRWKMSYDYPWNSNGFRCAKDFEATE